MCSAAFARVADHFACYMVPILVGEGGSTLTNDPCDRGGVTIYGITEATARACGYLGPMADMTEAAALGIYRMKFWAGPAFDKIDEIHPALAEYLLNIGINRGPERTSSNLQRALNVLNNAGAAYKTIEVDGHLGPQSLAALKSYRALRKGPGDLVMLGVMRALTAADYVAIAEADPSQAKFEYGWLRRALSV